LKGGELIYNILIKSVNNELTNHNWRSKMKKILLSTIVMMLFASWSFTASFTPTVMTITAPDQIEYQFDGSELTIPFTLSGKPGAIWLVIQTHGKGAEIGFVQNGYLGWHTVNGIDTTIYVSQRYSKEPGSVSIVWDGIDENGNAASAGTYDYFLWGYDDKSNEEMVCDFTTVGHGWHEQYGQIWETDTDGMPLAQPLMGGNWPWWGANADVPYKQNGAQWKRVIGTDPYDEGAIQYTVCQEYNTWEHKSGGMCFDPNDWNIFYHCIVNLEASTNTFLKWQWVSEGDAVLDQTWGGFENIEIPDYGQAIGVWSKKPSLVTDRNYLFGTSHGYNQKELEWNKLRCVSFEGELIYDVYLHEWYMPQDINQQGKINGEPHDQYIRGNQMILTSQTACFQEVIDPTRLIADPDAEFEDYVVWRNGNGDYFMDHGYQADFEPAWACLHEAADYLSMQDAFIDANGMAVLGTSFIGLTAFTLATPDGTAISYCNFADDVLVISNNNRGGIRVCDSGSAYDGFYGVGPVTEAGSGPYGLWQTMWGACDSDRGIITNEPTAVEEDKQATFSVDQNAPNPFNPTTTLSFTIPATGHVTVDIYNIAGQKIDTLLNDKMTAGKHSIVWDASGLSAGIYFYTIKSGNFSKTMKMTLLK